MLSMIPTYNSCVWTSRVHTMAMPVVAEVQDLFRAVDGGATLALLAKLAMEKACASKLDETRNAIQVQYFC